MPRRGLFLRQTIYEVVHDNIGHLDVLTRDVIEMVATNGEGIAIAAEYEDMQVRTHHRDAAQRNERARSR